MQVASRQPMWRESGHGVVVEVEMTAATGRYISIGTGGSASIPRAINWGDGTRTTTAADGDVYSPHTYALAGRYKICADGAKDVFLRQLDGQPQYPYDAAILSVVDYSGKVAGSRSGAFKP